MLCVIQSNLLTHYLQIRAVFNPFSNVFCHLPENANLKLRLGRQTIKGRKTLKLKFQDKNISCKIDHKSDFTSGSTNNKHKEKKKAQIQNKKKKNLEKYTNVSMT